ncbi:MAG: class I SAM-dependent rRNA methyltransferase [Deltaproteobacteria bacterium]|nr:MAG: class I SAM-dependent rRNA methyltransferase [Deltaproteobacteria bacterium]
MNPVDVALTRDTVGSIARGHPWVWAEGVAGPRPPAGTPVVLKDDRGRPVAFGLSDRGPIAIRVLSRFPLPLPRLVASAVAAAADLRAAMFGDDTDAFRLVNGAGDGLPGVVVDRYADLAVIRLYGACWEPWLEPLADAVAAVPGIATVARRLGVRRVDGSAGVERLAGPPIPDELVVRESGLRFLVRPGRGQKTGLFLDQRENRWMVRRFAADREVIDVFSCTGGFATHALAGGARRVIVVDVAPEAIADARTNLRLNGFEPDRHGFEVVDAFAWTPARPADLVVCDPPSLTHGRKADAAARRRYRDLATRYGRAVVPGGLLATASCTARLSFARWEQAVREGLRRAGRWSCLHRAAEPPDHPVLAEHPEARYLKFMLLQRRAEPAARAGVG